MIATGHHQREKESTMNRIPAIAPESTTGTVKHLLEGVQKKLGMVPNMMRTMAVAPTVLEGYLQLSGTLAGGTLSAKLREQIALTVAQANGCGYCLAAHCAIGGMVGLTKEQVQDSRLGLASDPHAHAALSLARAIVDERGRVSDEELAFARKAGLNDAEIAEVVANVALSIFTNYFNNLAGTIIDFPVAAPLEPTGATV